MADTKSIGIAYRDQAISGGTLDDTPIGGTTPSTVAATTLSATGASTLAALTATGETHIAAAASTVVGFHGVTGVAQAAVVAAVGFTGAATALIGFATTAQGQAVVDAVNSILTLLKEKGLMASA